MARVAFVLVFSLVLVLSIRSVLGEESTAASVGDQIGQAASDVKGGVSSLSSSAGDALKDTKDTVEDSSWGNWFKDKLEDIGLASESTSSDHPEAEKAHSPPSA